MEAIKVLALVGGISRNSLNRKLFDNVKKNAPQDFVIETFEISRLPFFSQDLENDPPDSVIEFKEKIRETDLILFITPEYNRSYPAVLKNAIDWGSRPYGTNLWDGKSAAIMGATISTVGTFGAQHHLRQVLAYLNMRVMGQPEFYFTDHGHFDESGNLTDKKTISLIQSFLDAFKKFSTQELNPLTSRTRKAEGLEDSPLAH